jgi:hypothetical protein
VACDGGGRPLGLLVTAGQRHESTQLQPLLDAIRVPRQGTGTAAKRHRSIATRYARLVLSYHAWLVLAALLLWLPI